uniref:HTH CENPB-type domain-containing protein n=1 Tax=Ganoderma boninense TaxID=34458 RepID=A0A5K1JSP1_9APHY|nr:HTH CENPB-type domain-containing protein [Ganoderma boninense]
MDTAQQYSSLVYHLQQPHVPHLPPHAISNSAPRQALHHDMPWPPAQHSALAVSASAPSVHVQMPLTMSQAQNHVDYASSSAQQQSYLSHHIPNPSAASLSSPTAVDPSSSSQALGFDSQVEGSIGPDRGLARRRFRMHERVHSQGDLPEYASLSQSYGHPQAPPHFSPQEGSRPHSPAAHVAYHLPDPTQSAMSNADAYGQQPRTEWGRIFPQTQPRSASGSAASASSNPRSASPALSVASALTSVSSASNSQLFTVESPVRKGPSLTRRDRKKRLYNIDRYKICIAAQEHPGMKQEDIASLFGVERSTVSKILKQKARWLSVSPNEKVLVAKLRPSKFPMLEGRLEDWVKNASKAGKVLTDQLLRKKAREFGDAMGFTQDKFKASSGWLENFKHRHGIRRGVWYGNGTLDQKYRAYASDFVPDVPEPIIPFPGTPPPIKEDRGYNDPIDTDDEGDAQALAAAEDENIPPTGVQGMQSSLGLIPDPWAKPIEPEGSRADQSVVHSFGSSSPTHLTYPSPYDGAPAVGADPMSMDMQAGSAADEAHGNEVALMSYAPEMVPTIEVMDDREAELCLQKLLVYLKEKQGELDVEPEIWANMFSIQKKIFTKVTGGPYTQAPLQLSLPRSAAS